MAAFPLEKNYPTPRLVSPSEVPTLEEIEDELHAAARGLVAPWNWWVRSQRRRLRHRVQSELTSLQVDFSQVSEREKLEVLADAVERVVGPYQNRLTLPAYAFLLGAISLNACIVTQLSSHPSLAIFAATLGGTLAGALGYQVLARLQAWAKQVSSNGGSLRTEQIPFNIGALDIWRRSQQLKNDLSRDGRNIRKDGWLQLHPRLEKAQSLQNHKDAIEAVADALIDHRQTYGEVTIDYWLAREFHRNLKSRFGNEGSFQAIRKVFRDTAPRHDLRVEELDQMLAVILKPETWQASALPFSEANASVFPRENPLRSADDPAIV